MNAAKAMDICSETKAMIRNSHIVYAKKADGWYHGYDYFNKDAIYPYTEYVKDIASMIALSFLKFNVQTVVGPTMGAVILAQWVAHWLNHYTGQFLNGHGKVLAVYADEEDVVEMNHVTFFPPVHREILVYGRAQISVQSIFAGEHKQKVEVSYQSRVNTRRIIKRGYDVHVRGKNCLVIDDVVSSGQTIIKTREAVERCGGIVIGAGVLCNRSGGKVDSDTLGVPGLFSLLNFDMPIFKEEECPICKERGVESVRTDIGKGAEFLARIGKR